MLTVMYVFLPPDYGLKSTLSSQWMEAAVVAYALIDLCEKNQGEYSCPEGTEHKQGTQLLHHSLLLSQGLVGVKRSSCDLQRHTRQEVKCLGKADGRGLLLLLLWV